VWAAILIGVLALFFMVAGTQAGANRQMDTQPIVPPYGTPAQSIIALASAITTAENSDPKYNNPGDLKPPSWPGATFGAGIAVFGSPQEGLARLYHQLNLIRGGLSRVYTLDDTIATMAQKWTGGNNAGYWAQSVAQFTGYTIDTPLSEVLA
jgi:hypothetical protein